MTPRFLLLFLSIITVVCPLRAEETKPDSALLAGALRTSTLGGDGKSVSIPLEPTHFGLVVNVTINAKPLRLILDTGASSTMISPAAARRLDLKAEERAGYGLDAGANKVKTNRALTSSIQIGAAVTRNEPVYITEVPSEFGDGMLGVATLADWDARIDVSKKTLTLFPAGTAPAIKGETTLPMTFELWNPELKSPNPQKFRNMSLSIPLRLNGHEILLTPDTGYGGIMSLPVETIESIVPGLMRSASPALDTGINLSGISASRVVKLPEIGFGPDTLKNVTADAVTPPPGSPLNRKGFIGLNLLRHYVMTFRFSAGELRLQPIGTVDEITRNATAGIYMDAGSKIIGVMSGGPAEKAGILVGDTLLAIEGHELKTMNPEEFATFKRLPPARK
jgi:predicted aspartyl protease